MSRLTVADYFAFGAALLDAAAETKPILPPIPKDARPNLIDIAVEDVPVGRAFLHGTKSTHVVKKTVAPAGCRHSVHINDNECWNLGFPVRMFR